MPDAPNRLAIVAPNWLGDALMALPLLADLRRAWPDTTMVAAARKSVAPLFPLVRAVNDTIILDGSRDVQRLAEGQFDAALLLPNSFASAWLVKRAQIPERWGFARDLRGPLLTRRITRPPRYGHQVEYYQALGTALGVASGPPFAAIAAPPSAHASAATLLQGSGIADEQPFVVAAPGAAYGRAKQWLPARFAELVYLMASEHITTVLIGAKGDISACKEVASAAPAVNLCGRTDLATLAALLTRSRAVVANDSGAMHLAAAVGVKVVAIFGPTNDRKTSPLRATAQSPMPAILTADVWCRPCMLRECPIDHRCMKRISAARVYAATQANTDHT
jgi:heptosyltransferase-2